MKNYKTFDEAKKEGRLPSLPGKMTIRELMICSTSDHDSRKVFNSRKRNNKK